MRPSRVPGLGLVLAAILFMLPSATRSQCQYQDCFDGYLLATYDGSAMQLELSLAQRTFPNICRGNAVGFDVYRKTVGYTCGPEERLTDQPIPWVGECDEWATLTFTDPDVSVDQAYRYEARPVDAQRNPAESGIGQSGVIAGYGIVGTAVVAHGEPILGNNFTHWIGSCPGECTADGIFNAPNLASYLWTTVTVRCQSAHVVYYSNNWATSFSCTSAIPSKCLVAVEAANWGTMKRLYD